VPRLTRWLIRTALLYFVAALLLGLAQVSPALRMRSGWLANAWPGYVHLFMLGWLSQLIVGVAFWLFPRRAAAEIRPALGWWGYGLVNAGLLLRVALEPAAINMARPAVGWLLAAAALAQLAGAAAWVALLWPRVRPR
jgi:hypothetical protein